MTIPNRLEEWFNKTSSPLMEQLESLLRVVNELNINYVQQIKSGNYTSSSTQDTRSIFTNFLMLIQTVTNHGLSLAVNELINKYVEYICFELIPCLFYNTEEENNKFIIKIENVTSTNFELYLIDNFNELLNNIYSKEIKYFLTDILVHFGIIFNTLHTMFNQNDIFMIFKNELDNIKLTKLHVGPLEDIIQIIQQPNKINTLKIIKMDEDSKDPSTSQLPIKINEELIFKETPSVIVTEYFKLYYKMNYNNFKANGINILVLIFAKRYKDHPNIINYYPMHICFATMEKTREMMVKLLIEPRINDKVRTKFISPYQLETRYVDPTLADIRIGLENTYSNKEFIRLDIDKPLVKEPQLPTIQQLENNLANFLQLKGESKKLHIMGGFDTLDNVLKRLVDADKTRKGGEQVISNDTTLLTAMKDKTTMYDNGNIKIITPNGLMNNYINKYLSVNKNKIEDITINIPQDVSKSITIEKPKLADYYIIFVHYENSPYYSFIELESTKIGKNYKKQVIIDYDFMPKSIRPENRMGISRLFGFMNPYRNPAGSSSESSSGNPAGSSFGNKTNEFKYIFEISGGNNEKSQNIEYVEVKDDGNCGFNAVVLGKQADTDNNDLKHKFFNYFNDKLEEVVARIKNLNNARQGADRVFIENFKNNLNILNNSDNDELFNRILNYSNNNNNFTQEEQNKIKEAFIQTGTDEENKVYYARTDPNDFSILEELLTDKKYIILILLQNNDGYALNCIGNLNYYSKYQGENNLHYILLVHVGNHYDVIVNPNKRPFKFDDLPLRVQLNILSGELCYPMYMIIPEIKSNHTDIIEKNKWFTRIYDSFETIHQFNVFNPIIDNPRLNVGNTIFNNPKILTNILGLNQNDINNLPDKTIDELNLTLKNPKEYLIVIDRKKTLENILNYNEKNVLSYVDTPDSSITYNDESYGFFILIASLKTNGNTKLNNILCESMLESHYSTITSSQTNHKFKFSQLGELQKHFRV